MDRIKRLANVCFKRFEKKMSSGFENAAMIYLSQNLAHKCVSIQVWLLISGQVADIADMWRDPEIGAYMINFQDKRL